MPGNRKGSGVWNPNPHTLAWRMGVCIKLGWECACIRATALQSWRLFLHFLGRNISITCLVLSRMHHPDALQTPFHAMPHRFSYSSIIVLLMCRRARAATAVAVPQPTGGVIHTPALEVPHPHCISEAYSEPGGSCQCSYQISRAFPPFSE